MACHRTGLMLWMRHVQRTTATSIPGNRNPDEFDRKNQRDEKTNKIPQAGNTTPRCCATESQPFRFRRDATTAQKVRFVVPEGLFFLRIL